MRLVRFTAIGNLSGRLVSKTRGGSREIRRGTRKGGPKAHIEPKPARTWGQEAKTGFTVVTNVIPR